MPYLCRAQHLGWATVICCPNTNFQSITASSRPPAACPRPGQPAGAPPSSGPANRASSAPPQNDPSPCPTGPAECGEYQVISQGRRKDGAPASKHMQGDGERIEDSAGRRVVLAGSENQDAHVAAVWAQVVCRSSAKWVVIVAHSTGGTAALNLTRAHPETFAARVRAVALVSE